MKFFRSWSRKIATALGVVLLLVLVVDFNSRMIHLMELRGEKSAEEARLDELLSKENALRKAIAYAESDEAIAEWAREQNWMGEEGDIVIVPISDGTNLPDQEISTSEPQEYLSNWDAWILWLTFRE